MDIDEVSSNNSSNKGHHANIESVKDDEFFEFEDVESIFNKDTDVNNC